MEQAVKNFVKATDFTFIPSENMKVHIFKVKPTDKALMKLIETGVFNGNESIIRKTTTKDNYGDWDEHVYTIIHKDGSSWSWHRGTSGHTCIGEETLRKMRIIDRNNEKFQN